MHDVYTRAATMDTCVQFHAIVGDRLRLAAVAAAAEAGAALLLPHPLQQARHVAALRYMMDEQRVPSCVPDTAVRAGAAAAAWTQH